MNEQYGPFFDVNKRRWNEKVEANQSSMLYDVDGFLRGGTSLLPIELEEVGDVEGKTMLHLQCHFGMDTLSWARKGAIVTGIDFSPIAIERARWLSERTGVPGRFIESNIYSLEEVLDEEFDIVYTSYGVLCWLPDLKAWTRTVARYLKRGGFFYIVEGHPFGMLMDEGRDDMFQASYPYFSDEAILFEDDFPTLDRGWNFKNKARYEWNHTLGGIVTELIGSGLRLEFLHEFPQAFFPLNRSMVKGEDGYWYFTDPRINVPMLFSLKATKE